MFIPIRTDSPLRTTPYVNWVLIVLNIAIFTAQAGGQDWYEPYLLHPRDPKLYQFFTYQFLHGGVMHLLGNMLFLYIFGNNVCDKLGGIGYLAFYLAGGVFAGIAHTVFDSNPVLGASGSIAAVTGAYLVLLPTSRVTVLLIFYIITAFEMAGMWFVLLFFMMDVVNQFGGMFGGAQAVAHMAHIGGTVFGFVICMTLLWFRLLPRDMFDVLALLDRWNRRRMHRDMVNRGYNPFEYSSVSEEPRKPNPMQDRIQDLRAMISESIAHRNLPQAAKYYQELRGIDPEQVLSRQSQLDVANQLYQEDSHSAAADAYELYLRTYPRAEQVDHVKLICGLLYARYLNRYDRAKELLESALPKLTNPRESELAREELSRITPMISAR